MNSHNTNKYNDEISAHATHTHTHSMNTQLVRVPTGRTNNCMDGRLPCVESIFFENLVTATKSASTYYNIL